MSLEPPRLEDPTMRIGLLMEAAQAQQTLAAAALERLRDHTSGLDDVVRDEIRAAIADGLRALADETLRTVEALRRLQRAASLRLVVWNVLTVAAAGGVPAVIAWRFLPSRAEVAALELRKGQLTAEVESLRIRGGGLDLRPCGTAGRLCVRVDRKAPVYGEHADFLVVKDR